MPSQSHSLVATHLLPMLRLLTFTVPLVLAIALPQFAVDFAAWRTEQAARTDKAPKVHAATHTASRPAGTR